MHIKTKFPDHNRSYTFTRICFLMTFFMCSSYMTTLIDRDYYRSRASLYQSSGGNVTLPRFGNLCHIPFDNCRCSLMTNTTNSTVECISDVLATAGHILPLVSYILQIYTISILFSFTGYRSELFTDMFWVITLVAFIIIAIVVRGSSCLQCYSSLGINISGLLLTLFLLRLVKRAHDLTAARQRNDRPHQERVVFATPNQEPQVTIGTNTS